MSTKTKRQQQIWLATVKCCQFNVSTDKVRESTDDVTITLATYNLGNVWYDTPGLASMTSDASLSIVQT